MSSLPCPQAPHEVPLPFGVGTDIVDGRPFALPRSGAREGVRHAWSVGGHERRLGDRELVARARHGVDTFESDASIRAAPADAVEIPPLPE